MLENVVILQGYSEQFIGYTIDDFRMPPNVFDILSSVDTGIIITNYSKNDHLSLASYLSLYFYVVFIEYNYVNEEILIFNRNSFHAKYGLILILLLTLALCIIMRWFGLNVKSAATILKRTVKIIVKNTNSIGFSCNSCLS